ncbi:MAG: hypothetical protein AABY33_03060 [Pseudomonadota bacterium]
MKQNEEPFEELIIPRRDMQISAATVYRIYSDYKNFQLVEAGSALEAIAMCGNQNVYKIKRHDPLGDNVIHLNQAVLPIITQNQIIAVDNVVTEKAMQEPAENTEVSEEQTAAASQAAAETPLSNDDIDKLLNG